MNEEKIIGLIAGAGRLPVIVANAAKKCGYKIICIGLEDNVADELKAIVDFYYPVALARCGGWIRKLRKHKAHKTIMVGKVEKKRIYTPFRILRYIPDWRAIRIWYWRLRKQDKTVDLLLGAIADELASGGIILQDSTMFNQKDLADEGLMTNGKVNANIMEDIKFGFKIAKILGQADIGQAVTIKEQETIAVEAIEGTSKMLERTSQLCGKGWTLVKTAKPNQDLRFDVPCIGIDTINSIVKLGGICIAVEAKKTFIIDKEQTIELANKNGITIYGITESSS
jgi:DUF1009 family protein